MLRLKGGAETDKLNLQFWKLANKCIFCYSETHYLRVAQKGTR